MQNLPTKTNQALSVHSESTDDLLQRAIDNLSIGEKRLLEVIDRFNQLRAYPLNIKEQLLWKDSLMKLVSKDLAELSMQIDFVIDKMMIGEIDYDNRLGIQNIIYGLKQIEGETGKYKLRFKW